MRRFWRVLRSRRLAIAAIVAFAAYAAMATVISDGDYASPYGSPVFLAISALLGLTTAACAWERTRAAIASSRLRAASSGMVSRLRTAPAFQVQATGEDVADRAEAVLRELGMRTLRGDETLEARAGLAGAFGSPIFHWALALLIVAVAVGQLTRYEGLMGIVAGSSRPDAPQAYGTLDTGLLVTELSGRQIAVPSVEDSYVASGIDQGVTPYIELRSSDGSELLTSGYAYANHPIRYGSMLIHHADFGLAAVVEVGTDGGTWLTREVLLDYNEERTAVEPAGFEITGADGRSAASVLIEPAAGSTAEAPTVRIMARAGSGVADTTQSIDVVVEQGGQTTLPGDFVLRVVRLTKYVRISVVNDASVYVIYALFLLAVIGLVLAIFMPTRGVRVLPVLSGDVCMLHVVVRHGRGDPHFSGAVEHALRAAFESEEQR